MRRARPCSDNAEAIFEKIRIHSTHFRRRHIISRIRHDILSAYSRYIATTPNLQTLVSICSTDAQRTALKDFYDKKTKPCIDLIKRVYQIQDDTQCPYCTIDTIGTIDHYLGRATHPEFSVFPQNLIPSCAKCNNPLSRIDSRGARRVLHFYDDPIEQIPGILRARITPPDEVEFRLHPPRRPSRIARLYLKHCHSLGLLEKYRLAATSKLGTFEKEIWAARRHGVDEIRRMQLEIASEEAQERGPNFWEVPLRRAAATKTFIRFVLA